MSVARQVKMNYDLKALSEAAVAAGFMVTRHTAAHGWDWGPGRGSIMKGAENCDLVISSRQHRFQMGFVKQRDGSVQMFADEHGGYVKRDLQEKIIPRYLEQMGRGRVKIEQQVKEGNKVVLTLGRV